MATRIVAARGDVEIKTKPAPAPDEPPIKWKKPTYKQQWELYDAAQTNEKDQFQRLLADLCGTIQEPVPEKRGRGNVSVPLAVAIFSSVFKIYTGFSGRRFASDLRDAHRKKYVSQVVHHSTVARCLEDPETTTALIRLIELSALPFKAIETEFAADSSGFSACKFDRWYDEKYGSMKSERAWVKAHVMVGTTTHTIAAVIVDRKDSPDSPQFPQLVKTTAQGFTIKQASTDKAYTSEENFQAVDRGGGVLYSAFKSNATGGVGGIYQKMYHLFCLNRDDYLSHYHRRSNNESVFSAVKRLMGDSVRSKTETAMRNEVLGKLLSYNITCLVHAIYELGLDPTFSERPEECTILRFPGVA